MKALASALATLALGASLLGCGSPPPPTVWVYDEATTLAHTEEVERASAKKHLAGFALRLEIQEGNFVMQVAGGKAPGEYRGTVKATFDGVLLLVSTVDGKPVADKAGAETKLRQ